MQISILTRSSRMPTLSILELRGEFNSLFSYSDIYDYFEMLDKEDTESIYEFYDLLNAGLYPSNIDIMNAYYICDSMQQNILPNNITLCNIYNCFHTIFEERIRNNEMPS